MPHRRERPSEPKEQPAGAQRPAAQPNGLPDLERLSFQDAAGLQQLVGNQAVGHLLAQRRMALEDHSTAEEVTPDDIAGVVRGGGKPLEEPILRRAEGATGMTMSHVRVHTGADAAASAAAMDARAYTVGSDIVVGRGGNDEETLLHEAKHIEQQARGAVPGRSTAGGLQLSHPDDSAEREATRFAAQAVRTPSPAPAADSSFHDGDTVRRTAATGPVQRANDQEPQTSANPARSGQEIELGGTVLEPAREAKRLNNGTVLARTTARDQMGSIPLLKAEVEGGDRGTPVIELVYGPVTAQRAGMKAFGNARGKLITELSNGGAFTEIIRRFNTSLRGQEADYALTAEATATPLRVKRFLSANASRAADQTIPMNFQTNVSVPYAKLGQEGPQDPTQENEYAGFEDFFGPNEQTPRAMYVRAREQANALAPAAGFSSEVKALLTHIMHHYAMYENAQVTPHGEGPEDKHKFHVMIKMSPQDAVMTILSAADVTGLSTWLAVPGNRRTLREAYLRVLPPSGRASAVTDDTLPGELTPALDARSTLDARNNRDNRVLLDVMDQDGDTFTVPLGQGDSAAINILHPRRSNRVPVYAGDQQYWVVIEQRSANHPLNDPTQVKDKAKRDLVTALIAKLQKL